MMLRLGNFAAVRALLAGIDGNWSAVVGYGMRSLIGSSGDVSSKVGGGNALCIRIDSR